MGGSVGQAGDNEGKQGAPESAVRENSDKIYFAHNATLRIFGNIPDLDEITQALGITPSSTHRKGDRFTGRILKPYAHDMWSYDAPAKETEPLHVHIDNLWNTFKGRKEYLIELKSNLAVDVFLGYRSNCDNAGVEVPYQSLEIFRELQIPFGLSIIVV
jgi:hypothetical protein